MSIPCPKCGEIYNPYYTDCPKCESFYLPGINKITIKDVINCIKAAEMISDLDQITEEINNRIINRPDYITMRDKDWPKMVDAIEKRTRQMRE